MQIIQLPAPTPIERKLARALGGPSRPIAAWREYPNGEIGLNVRAGRGDAVVIGRTHPPGDHAFASLLAVDTLRRCGAGPVEAVVPYFGYARHDRQVLPGDDAAAAFLIEAFACAGASRIVTVDLHSDRVREHARIPIESVIVAADLAAAVRRTIGERGLSVVAPDHGARHRAELVASALGIGTASWVEKSRDPRTGRVRATALRGDVPGGGDALIVDDMVDTGGTVREAARLLKKEGIRHIHLCVTHAVCSPGVAAALRKAGIRSVIATNTLPPNKETNRLPRLTTVDVSSAVARAVRGGR
jgi:ribose-phosphate pyrophosphokinase